MTAAPPTTAPQGAWLLIAAVTCYACMDTLTRGLPTQLSAHAVNLVRFFVHATFMGAWLLLGRARGSGHRFSPTWPSQIARGVLLYLSALLAVNALRHMPVAEYTAVVMVTPVVTTLLTHRLLQHDASRRQWWLVIAGFLGAMIVIRPGSGLFGLGASFALGVVIFNAIYQTMSNHHGPREDAVVSTFIAGAVGLLLSAVSLWVQPDVLTTTAAMLDARQWALLLSIGLLATLAQWFIVEALSRARAASLMPFMYVQIPIAALFAWWWLGDLPDVWGWVGMALIGVAGVMGARTRTPAEARVVASAAQRAGP